MAVALAFPLALLVSSAPYLWCGLSLLDTVFEGMSGITGTGLTRYTDIDAQPFALHFLRAWQQWVGGYAIVTLTVALLPRRATAAQQMAESDIADDAGKDGDEKPNLAERAKQVTLVYGLLTVACILLTWATGFPFHQALLHGLTAVSTAGFSSLNNSLTDVPHVTTACLMAFALLGAVALSDYVRPAIERAGLRKLGAVVFVLVSLSAVFGLGVFSIERSGPAPVALFDALQVASSAQSTTGFSSLAVPDLSASSKALLIVSMYIGGDLGSTAGGIKLMRFAALAFALYAVFRPRADLPDTPGDGAKGALRLIVAWAGFTVIGWLCLILAGHAPIDALFEWASALNNTGLTAGPSSEGTPPVLTRVALILAMWLGRVEILAALLLLKPSVWRTRD
nr:potassium transporter TrkG [Parvularcula dongshanensis]